MASPWQARTHGTPPEREVVVQLGLAGGLDACLGVDFESFIENAPLPEGPPPIPLP